MKTYYFMIIFVAFCLFSCEKEDKSNDDLSINPPDLSKNPPETPDAMNFDLNDDSVDDIKIEYRWIAWDGINSSGYIISGTIEPLNKSSILLKRDKNPLFNELNDTIRFNTNEPYYWEKYLHQSIVSISNSSVNDYLWPNEWRIHSNMTMDSYYLGIRINNNSQLVGWIQIQIDKSTGAIQILNKKFICIKSTMFSSWVILTWGIIIFNNLQLQTMNLNILNQLNHNNERSNPQEKETNKNH